MVDKLNVGLYVRLEAAEGRGDEVAELLRGGQAMVEEEPDTLVWYAVRYGPSTFGIFDAFEGDDGRNAHLNGAVAKGLAENADLFAQPPSIEQVDIIASK